MLIGALIALALPSLAAEGTPGRDQAGDVLSRINGEAITLKDFDLAIFWNEYPLVRQEILPNLIQEQLVRQEVSRKGISVKSSEVDEFVADLDRSIRASDKTKSLADYLIAQGMDLAFFRRKSESVVGLCRLAGGQGRVYEETQNPAIKEKMNALLATLAAGAKVETDVDKLEAGVAATVNGERLMIEEVGRVARARLDPETKRRNLGYVQVFVTVRQEMARRKVELTPPDLDYQIELLCAQRPSGSSEKISIADVLKSLGHEPKILRRQSDFQARAMLTRMVKADITEEDVRGFFDADPARFGEGVPKASHIMLKTIDAQNRPFSVTEDHRVRAKALELREKLVAGEDFAAMAGKYSDDKETADRGGALGFLDKSRIKDPVVAAAYGLKVGEISQPVKGSSGWHLVKVMEIKHVTFDNVKPEVRARLLAERSFGLLRGIKDKARIEPGPAKL